MSGLPECPSRSPSFHWTRRHLRARSSTKGPTPSSRALKQSAAIPMTVALRNDRNPQRYVDYAFSIYPEQGDLSYLLCRAMGAKRVAEFATSVGMSTLYFAAAVRDNGGGIVIGSEIVPSKIAVAKRNLA